MNLENKDNETKLPTDGTLNDAQETKEVLVSHEEPKENISAQVNPLEGVEEPVLADTPLEVKPLNEKVENQTAVAPTGESGILEVVESVPTENIPMEKVEAPMEEKESKVEVVPTVSASLPAEEKNAEEPTNPSFSADTGIPNLTENSLPKTEQPMPGLPQIEIENQAEGMLTEEMPIIEDTGKVKPPMENTEEPKKKSKKGLVIGFVIILLLGLATLCYFLFFNTKNLFLAAVNKEYGNIVNNIGTISNNKYNEAKNSSIVTEGNFKITMDANKGLGASFTGVASELSKLNGTYTFGTDYKNKTISALLNLHYNQDNMLSVGTYGTNKNLYLELKNLFSKYISFPLEDYEAIFSDPNVKVEDMKTMTKIVKNAFLDSLDTKDFTKETVTTKIGDKEEKVNKISYAITKNNIYVLYESILTKLKKDKTFVNLLATYTGEKEEEVKTNLEKSIAAYKGKELLSNDSIELNVYTKGLLNTAVKYGMVVNNLDTSATSVAEITYAKEDKKTYIELIQNNNEIANIIIEKQTDSKYMITSSIGEMSALINYTKENNTYNIDYAITDSDNTSKISGTIINSETKQNKAYDGTGTFTLDYEMDGTKYLSVKAENTYKTTIGSEVEVPEIKNSIDIKQLTEKDTNTILANLMQNPAFMTFATNIMAYIY